VKTYLETDTCCTMTVMKRIHYWAGTLGLVVFVLQGQYMQHALGELVGMADGPRMLYRSAHIYLFLASLLNLGLALNYTQAKKPLNRFLQTGVSVVALIAPLILLAAFFIEPGLVVEPGEVDFERLISKAALYPLFVASVVLVYLGAFKE